MTTQTPQGQALGVTITSFCSVSLKPPLILFCLGKDTRNIGSYTESGCFVVNILSQEQANISEIFASDSSNKFQGICFEKGTHGCPIIPGCVTSLECDLVEVHDSGDHLILVGQVKCLRTTHSGGPLLRYRGKYAGIAERELT